jgi:curli production assembly/transport component CsgG/holdfast attachment protein HfaB
LVGQRLNSGRNGIAGGVVSGGTQAVEPLQAAVRTLVERGVFELLAGMQTPEAYSGCLERAEIDS